MTTEENDLVLDSFLGSGTTAAVAQKMKRRWICVELGDHAYSLCKQRLDGVVDGRDNGGITKTVEWKGGGGYHGQEGNVELGAYIESAKIAKQVKDVFTQLVFKKVFVEFK